MYKYIFKTEAAEATNEKLFDTQDEMKTNSDLIDAKKHQDNNEKVKEKIVLGKIEKLDKTETDEEQV